MNGKKKNSSKVLIREPFPPVDTLGLEASQATRP